MTDDTESAWLAAGQGAAPHLRWSFTTEAPLVDVRHVRETGETVAADKSGGLYLLDRRGTLQTVSRAFHGIVRIAWSDSGNGGALLMEDDQLVWLGRDLTHGWQVCLPSEPIEVAIDPFGHHIAVSMSNRGTFIYNNWKKKPVAEFATIRPLSFVRFAATRPLLIGVAEHGLLCCHELDGTEVWNETVWTNVGRIRINPFVFV